MTRSLPKLWIFNCFYFRSAHYLLVGLFPFSYFLKNSPAYVQQIFGFNGGCHDLWRLNNCQKMRQDWVFFGKTAQYPMPQCPFSPYCRYFFLSKLNPKSFVRKRIRRMWRQLYEASLCIWTSFNLMEYIWPNICWHNTSVKLCH